MLLAPHSQILIAGELSSHMLHIFSRIDVSLVSATSLYKTLTVSTNNKFSQHGCVLNNHCWALPLETHGRGVINYQCHIPSHCSTYYCWEVRVKCGLLLPLSLTLRWTAVVTSSELCVHVVYQLRARGLCRLMQFCPCRISLHQGLKSTTINSCY